MRSEIFGDFSDSEVIERAKVHYSYDDLGNLQSKMVEGVCNETFHYGRDHGGWLRTLTSSIESTDDGSCQDARTYVELAEYNVRGQASLIRYGNGLKAGHHARPRARNIPRARLWRMLSRGSWVGLVVVLGFMVTEREARGLSMAMKLLTHVRVTS